VHASEAGRLGHELGSGQEALGALAAPQVEGDHASEAAHLAARDLVRHVPRQPRVAHARHVLACRQRLRQRQRIRAGALHPERQRRERAVRQPGLERSGDGARVAAPVAQPLGRLGVARGHIAEHQVGVAREVLGRAREREVRAQVEHLLAERPRRGVVHDTECPGTSRGLGERGDVVHVELRVRGRLEPQHRRALERVEQLGVVREAHLHPARLEVRAGEAADVQVAVAVDGHGVAGPQCREQERRRRSHAGCEQHHLAALELGQRGLVALPGRVAVARVDPRRRVHLALQVERAGERRTGQEGSALLGLR
jgi:hypothetical protein